MRYAIGERSFRKIGCGVWIGCRLKIQIRCFSKKSSKFKKRNCSSGSKTDFRFRFCVERFMKTLSFIIFSEKCIFHDFFGLNNNRKLDQSKSCNFCKNSPINRRFEEPSSRKTRLLPAERESDVSPPDFFANF